MPGNLIKKLFEKPGKIRPPGLIKEFSGSYAFLIAKTGIRLPAYVHKIKCYSGFYNHMKERHQLLL